jgi:hypothetical protein
MGRRSGQPSVQPLNPLLTDEKTRRLLNASSPGCYRVRLRRRIRIWSKAMRISDQIAVV